MAGRLEGRIALVTGSGRGIGRATALLFAREGASVVVTDIEEENATSVAEEIRSAGGTAHLHCCDIRAEENVRVLFDTVETSLGPVDTLVNNAGGATPGRFEDCDPDSYRDILALNLDAVWHCTQNAVRHMLPRERGAIVTISSGAGILAAEGLAAYGAAKSGVQSLMRNIAQEYGAFGLRANTIAPGPIASPGMMNWVETLPGGEKGFNQHLPARRFGKPEEIANAALFLASDEASYVNGVLLPVDGGATAVMATSQRDILERGR